MDTGSPQPRAGETDDSLHSTELTWVALLGRWLDFARASVALPDNASGRRWMASVAPIINLQAVTFALGQLDELAADERALGQDRAEILIHRATEDLEGAWSGTTMPPLVRELMEDAAAALTAAQTGTVIEFIVPGDGGDDDRFGLDQVFEMPPIDDLVHRLKHLGFDGDLWAALPGTLLAPGEPALHVGGQHEETAASVRAIEEFTSLRSRRIHRPMQIYRRVDEAGRIVEDQLIPLDAEPIAGRPLLVARIEKGNSIAGGAAFNAARWADQQRAAWPEAGLPVRQGEAP